MHQNLRRVRVIRNRRIGEEARGVYKYRVRLEAIAESYIHVGSGLIQPLFDLDEIKRTPVDKLEEMIDKLKFLDKIPPFRDSTYYIPGSSIKGAIRTRAELMFRSYNGETPTCFIVYDQRSLPSRNHQRVWGDVIYEARFRCDATRQNYVCEVCDIFGAPGLLAKIAFSDFTPVNNESIDVLEIYREPIIVFKKGTHFVGEMLLGDLEDYQFGLLLHAMRIPENKPILIGRYKYKKVRVRGKDEYFGRLRFRISSIEPDEIDMNQALDAFKDRLGVYFRDDLDETAW